MKPSKYDDIIKNLIPELSAKEKQEIRAYFDVYEKYLNDFSDEAMEELKQHPVFGKIISDIPKEIADERNKISRELQKNAIIDNNWHPYIQYQIEQGIGYAKMGLAFKSWYEVVSLARKYLTPYLHKEYGDGEAFIAAINGMNTIMDIGMGIIGEAYMQEKNEIIREDQEEIKKLNLDLEQKVTERTAELQATNRELEAFSYSVSHDLRAPLRAVHGYAQMLLEDHGPKLDSEGRRIIQTIKHNATNMGTLIDELLAFSKLGRKEIVKTDIDMNVLAADLLEDLNKSIPNVAKIQVGKLHQVYADYAMFRQMLFNLIANAVKYSAKKDKPTVDIRSEKKNGEVVLSVSDNGAGFDMSYANKLFGVFQRLHSQEEFEGMGIGLALVQRIITKHGGRVWAEGAVDEGATFYCAVPVNGKK